MAGFKTKSVPFDYQVKADGRTFDGHAAVFNNLDSYRDRILPGAFVKTIKEGLPANRIKVLWQHCWDRPIGLPLNMSEDSTGLLVEARVSAVPDGDMALQLMRDKVVDALSIGYRTVKFNQTNPGDGTPPITDLVELKLREFSPVTFGANDQALITGVKATETLRQILSDDPQAVAAFLAELQEAQRKAKAAGNPPPNVGDVKAGRMISAANAKIIQGACDALAATCGALSDCSDALQALLADSASDDDSAAGGDGQPPEPASTTQQGDKQEPLPFNVDPAAFQSALEKLAKLASLGQRP